MSHCGAPDSVMKFSRKASTAASVNTSNVSSKQKSTNHFLEETQFPDRNPVCTRGYVATRLEAIAMSRLKRQSNLEAWEGWEGYKTDRKGLITSPLEGLGTKQLRSKAEGEVQLGPAAWSITLEGGCGCFFDVERSFHRRVTSQAGPQTPNKRTTNWWYQGCCVLSP